MNIYLSKKKVALLFIASVLFVCLGIWGIIKPEELVSKIFRDPFFIRILGILSVCFFGLGVFLTTSKFFDSKPGLIIDESGIIDNSNSANIGLIEWSDIKGFERKEILSTKILLILIENPNKYIARAKNSIAKKSLETNNKRYGSPISIVSNSLKISFEDLERLIKEEWEKQKAR